LCQLQQGRWLPPKYGLLLEGELGKGRSRGGRWQALLLENKENESWRERGRRGGAQAG